MMNKEIRIYQPEGQIRMGWLAAGREMLKELVAGRELIWRLFVRDFLAKYKQAALGILWAVIMPVVVIGAFVFMNRAGVLNIGKTSIPYPAYAILGLTIWQLFATGLTTSSNSIIAGGSMVVKINFAKESLVISSLAQSLFDFLIRLVLVVLVFIYYRIVPAWTTIFFPFSLIPLILFTLGLGFIFSLLNCILRDVANVVTLFTSFLLFLTPVLYPVKEEGLLANFTKYNPLASLVNGPRDLIINGKLSQPVEYFAVAIFSLLIFLLGWRIFHLVEPKMAEYIGTYTS